MPACSFVGLERDDFRVSSRQLLHERCDEEDLISDDLVLLSHLLLVLSRGCHHVNKRVLGVVEMRLLFLVMNGVRSMEPTHLCCSFLSSARL